MKKFALYLSLFSFITFSSLQAQETGNAAKEAVAAKDSATPIVIGLGALAILSVVCAVIASSATSSEHSHSHAHQ